MAPQKIIIFGFPHSGTTIFRNIMGHIDNVEEMLCESRQAFKPTDKPYIVVKYPFTWDQFFKDEYKDYIKIFVIRNPLWIFSSLNKRFNNNIPSDHNMFSYFQVLKNYVKYMKEPIPNTHLIRYEDMFDNNHAAMRSIFDKIGLEYTDRIFQNKEYKNVANHNNQQQSKEVPDKDPGHRCHDAHRIYQINQPFVNNNFPEKLDLNAWQKQLLQDNLLVKEIYPEVTENLLNMDKNIKTKVFQLNFHGGLCNKLFCLFSACEIAIQQNIPLLEPIFGWKHPTNFSNIYDLNYFNEQMKQYNNGKIIMIPYESKNSHTIINMEKLWDVSERNLAKQRNECKMNKNCMNICVLNSLKLNSKYQHIIDTNIEIEHMNAMHIRVETDWVNYASQSKTKSPDEILLINVNTLIDLYKNKWSSDIFFTTGQNQNEIKTTLKLNNINSDYYFDKNVEYEINAAINFELMCKAKNFIGLSRSTFSNLITLKRHLLNNNNSFIYNYNNQIIERFDKGLHPDGKSAVTNTVLIV